MKGYIYLIRNQDLYKIGITRNIKQRMKYLRPDGIVQIFKSKTFKELEKRLHHKYKHVRIPQTEYFRLTKSMVKECKQQLTNAYWRRARCKPWLIGLLTMLISPAISIVWGIRQRSLALCIIPLLILIPFNITQEIREGNRILIQIASGVITFIIAKNNKAKTLN